MNPHAKLILPDEVMSAVQEAIDNVEFLRRFNPDAADALQAEMDADREWCATVEIAKWQNAGEFVMVQDALDWGIQPPDGRDAREVLLLKWGQGVSTQHIIPPAHVPVDPRNFDGMAIDLAADLEPSGVR